jgi:hypothetical protein
MNTFTVAAIINDMPKDYATQEDFNLELEKIPDIEIFKNQLSELFTTDKSSLTQEEIRKLYFEKAVLLPNAIATLPADTINLLKAFRVRLNINQNVEDLSIIRTFSYPNPCFCKDNGRANLRNKSVFYCADAFITAFVETKPKVGDIGYLSIWDIHCDRDVNYTAFFPSSMPEKNVWNKTATEYQKKMVDHAKESGNDKSKQLEELFEFTSNIFIKETSPYSLTSWIANSMLYDYYGVDFIVYPSFATNNITCNIAFHPNFVDNYVKLSKIYKYVITEMGDGNGSYSIKEVGKVFLTNIQWSEPTEEDIKEYFPEAKKVARQNNGC